MPYWKALRYYSDEGRIRTYIEYNRMTRLIPKCTSYFQCSVTSSAAAVLMKSTDLWLHGLSDVQSRSDLTPLKTLGDGSSHPGSLLLGDSVWGSTA